MKKFFALFTVLFVLVFAAGASAITLTVSMGNQAVTITAGKSLSFDVTVGDVQQQARVSYDISADAALAEVVLFNADNSKLFISTTTEVAAGGPYSVDVRAIETVQLSGHDTPQVSIAAYTISLTIAEPVLAPSIRAEPESVEISIGTDPKTVQVTAGHTKGFDSSKLEFSMVEDDNKLASITEKEKESATVTIEPDEENVGAGIYDVYVVVTESDGLYAASSSVRIPVSVIARTVTAPSDSVEAELQNDTVGVDITSNPEPISVTEVVQTAVEFTLNIITAAKNLLDAISDITVNTFIKVSISLNLTSKNSSITADVAATVDANVTQGAQNYAADYSTEDNPVTYVPSTSDTIVITAPKETSQEAQALTNGIMLNEVINANSDPNTEPVATDKVVLDGGYTMENTSDQEIVTTTSNTYPEAVQGKDIEGYDVLVEKDTSGYVETEEATVASFSGAAASLSSTPIIFLDSNGKEINKIPGNGENPDAIPGFVTMLMRLKPKTSHIPLITVSSTGLPENLTETQSNITIEVLKEKESTFTGQANYFFSTYVEWDYISDVDKTGGYTYYRISDDAGGRFNTVKVGEDWTRTPEETATLYNEGLVRIVRLPKLDASAETEDHIYVVKVSFDISDETREKILGSDEGGAFVFFPNGPKSVPATSRVRDENFNPISPEDFKNNNVTKGYLAFRIPAKSTLTRPMLAVRIDKDAIPEPGSFMLSVSETSFTVRRGESKTIDIAPANNSGDVTYEITPKEDWVTLTPDGNEASITFAPTNATAAAKHDFTLTAVDTAGNSQDIAIEVTVEPAQNTFSISASSSDITVRRGGSATVTITAAHNTGNVTYEITPKEDWVTLTPDGSTASITFAPTNTTAIEDHEFTVAASDTTGSRDSLRITVEVTGQTGGVGSSGGGCSTGFTAIALAVLGGFIARRKK